MAAAALRHTSIVEIGWYDFHMPKKRGPKPTHGETMKKYAVTLDSMSRRKLLALGEDSLSAAIRKAADVAYRQSQAITRPRSEND